MRTGRNTRLAASSGLFFVMLSAVTWGTVGVTTKTLYRISATTPLSVGFFRLGLAVPVLLLAGWLGLGRRMFQMARRDLAMMAAIGVLLALYQVCYFSAIRHLGVAVATLVTLCAAPVIVAVLSSLLAKERPTGRVLAALVCALAGTGMLVGVLPSAGMQGSVAAGGALAMTAALGYALFTLCSRSLAGRCHPLQTMAIGFGVGALSLLSLALSTQLVISYPRAGWALLAYLGLVPTALGYALFLVGMRRVTATVASIATLVEPLTSTVLAGLLFGERLGSLGWLGALLLGVTMVALLGEEARTRPVPAEPLPGPRHRSD